jgi:hypothetical protein
MATVQLQIVIRSGCVACLAMRLIIRRVSPDYPDLQFEEIDVVAQPDVLVQHGLRSAPAVVVDGQVVASRHLKEVDLRRALLRVAGSSVGWQPFSRQSTSRSIRVWAPATTCACGCGCAIRRRLRPYRLRRLP